MTKFPKHSPLDGALLGELHEFSDVELDAAVAAAGRAQREWSRLSAADRQHTLEQMAGVLGRHEAELVELLHLEQGKPRCDAAEEVTSGLQQLRRAADKALEFARRAESPHVVGETESHEVQQWQTPLGVVLALLPWNYPVYLALDKIARALAHGNSVILKPSPHTPLATVKIVEWLATEASLMPPGLVQAATGRDARVGEYLTRHAGVHKVSFVGSTNTGVRVRQNAAECGMKRVTLEMGGNDPALVLPDVELDSVATALADAALVNNGQICVAVKRIYVPETILDAFLDKFVSAVEAKVVGRDLGPVNNLMQYDKLVALIQDSLLRHGKILTGGVEPPALPHLQTSNLGRCGRQLYLKPTVIVGLDDMAPLVKEEQFGPVIPVLSYRDEAVDEAVRRCNASPVYGLGASVWGADVARANAVATRLDAGMVWVNEHGGSLLDAPFGGVKMSGLGREGDWGGADLLAYTETRIFKFAK